MSKLIIFFILIVSLGFIKANDESPEVRDGMKRAYTEGRRRIDEALNSDCLQRGFVMPPSKSRPESQKINQTSQCDMTLAIKAMRDEKVVIDKVDMMQWMQDDAIRFADEASKKFTNVKDIAIYIKSEFDKRYDQDWQCIVGTNFEFYVTRNNHRFINFHLGQMSVLLFKT